MAIYQTDKSIQDSIAAQAVIDALRKKSKAWEKLQGQDSTVTTGASGAFPGMTQVNWGGILGNGLGLYNQLSNEEDAISKEKAKNTSDWEALNALMGSHEATTGLPAGKPDQWTDQLGTSSPVAGDLTPEENTYLDAALQKYPNITREEAMNVLVKGEKSGATATSPKGAYGRWQVMPESSALFNKKYGTAYDPKNPRDNFMQGVQILDEAKSMSNGNPATMYSIYNAGAPNTLSSPTGVAQNPETEAYVQRTTGAGPSPTPPGVANALTSMGIDVPVKGAMGDVVDPRSFNQKKEWTPQELLSASYLTKTLGVDDQVMPMITPEKDKLGSYGALVSSRSGIRLLQAKGLIDQQTADTMVQGLAEDDKANAANRSFNPSGQAFATAYQTAIANGADELTAQQAGNAAAAKVQLIKSTASTLGGKSASESIKADDIANNLEKTHAKMTELGKYIDSGDFTGLGNKFADVIRDMGIPGAAPLVSWFGTPGAAALNSAQLDAILTQMKSLGGNDTEKELATITKTYLQSGMKKETAQAFYKELMKWMNVTKTLQRRKAQEWGTAANEGRTYIPPADLYKSIENELYGAPASGNKVSI